MAADASDDRRIARQAAAWVARRDAGLSPGEMAEFETWRSADCRHAAAVARYDSAWSALDAPRHSGRELPVLAELRRRQTRRRRQRATLAAAAAVIAVGVLWRFAPATHSAAVPVPTSVVMTRPTQQHLSDGTVIELKDGADVSVEFTTRFRRVVLRSGEAHFAVAKDSTRPFVVDAGDVEVRAVGTSFSVQLASRGVEVLVTEGRVAIDQVIDADGSLPLLPQTLAIVDAGNRAVVDLAPAPGDLPLATQVEPVHGPELSQLLAWRSPRLEFSGTPLVEAVALMNSHADGENDIRFSVTDSAIAQVRLSGFIRADNTEAFVRLLEASGEIRATRHGNEVTLGKP